MSAHTTGVKTILSAAVLVLTVTAAVNTVAAKSALEEIKLSAKQLPAGCTLANEYTVPAQGLKKYETRFGAGITTIVNQLLLVKGAQVKINYLLCPTPADAAKIYGSLIGEVGSTNIITIKNSVVVEIVAAGPLQKKEMLTLLAVSPLQNFELKATDLPDGWYLQREIYCYGNELAKIGKRFGVPMQEVTNQFILAGGKWMQINYLLCARPKDSAAACKKMREMSGKENIILCRSGLITEIISGSMEPKKQAEQILVKKIDKSS